MMPFIVCAMSVVLAILTYEIGYARSRWDLGAENSILAHIGAGHMTLDQLYEMMRGQLSQRHINTLLARLIKERYIEAPPSLLPDFKRLRLTKRGAWRLSSNKMLFEITRYHPPHER